MLASVEMVEAVAELLDSCDGIPVVVDPVAVSKHGDPLLSADAVATVRDRLLPHATVVTPNLYEVAQLTDVKVEDETGMRIAARALLAYGSRWVLVKGSLTGRPGGPVDERRGGARTTSGAQRQPPHAWDGMHLASAVASYLALGYDVPAAAGHAKAYVTGALESGFSLGAGIGPVDHRYRWRGRDPKSA